jgi:hypothetical protein
MKKQFCLRSIFVGLLVSFSGIAIAQAVEPRAAIAGELAASPQGDQSSESEKTWVSKSESMWRYRTDQANRILSFKREGSKGFEMEFKYEGDSRSPIAARLAGHEWRYKKPSDDSKSSSEVSDLSMGIEPAVPTQHLSKFLSPEEEGFMWQTYYDLMDMTNGFYSQLQLDWDYLGRPRTPEERDRCYRSCDLIADVGLLGCSLFVEIPAIAFACGAGQLVNKYLCKANCDK